MMTNKHSASATGASLLEAMMVRAARMTSSQNASARLGRTSVSAEYNRAKHTLMVDNNLGCNSVCSRMDMPIVPDKR